MVTIMPWIQKQYEMAVVCKGSAGNEVSSGNLTFRVVVEVVGLSGDGVLWDVLRDLLAFFDTRKGSRRRECGAE